MCVFVVRGCMTFTRRKALGLVVQMQFRKLSKLKSLTKLNQFNIFNIIHEIYKCGMLNVFTNFEHVRNLNWFFDYLINL